MPHQTGCMALLHLNTSKRGLHGPWGGLRRLAPAAELVLLAVVGICVLGFGIVVFLGPLIAALGAVPPESIVSWALGFAVCGVACFVGANALGDWHLSRNWR
jgi:hypothetical protein